MKQAVHLPRAPITEALMDVRPRLPSDLDPTLFDDLLAQLGAKYEHHDVREKKQATVRLHGGEVEADSRVTAKGHFYSGPGGVDLCQFRTDGFTYNRVGSYESWEPFFEEGWRLWSIYAEIAGVERVSRVAVRYINHLKIPIDRLLSEYVVTIPRSPEWGSDGRTMASFLTRLVLDDVAREVVTIFTQSFEGADDEGTATILLDIDSYMEGDFAARDEALQERFQTLHTVKNEVFFGSIHPTTVELCQ